MTITINAKRRDSLIGCSQHHIEDDRVGAGRRGNGKPQLPPPRAHGELHAVDAVAPVAKIVGRLPLVGRP